MKRLIALVVLSTFLAALSFKGDVLGYTARFARRDPAKTLAIKVRRTERLGINLAEQLN